MTGESLGTARLDLTIDTTDYEVAIAKSKNSAAGLSAEAQAAFSKIDGSAKRVSTTVLRWAETLGKTAEEQKILNAVMKGMPVEVAQEAVRIINEQRQATELAARAAQRLADTHAFEKQAAEAARLNQASEYVRFWTNALEEADRAQAHLAAQNSFISNLQQQAAAIGKTRSELLEMKAAELGVSQQAAPMIAALKAQENALYGTTTKLNQYGLSAKQAEFALRGVPAQMTDIFVSLQGGQNPLTVLLQQGGQLKDMFGGIRPAAEALTGALTKLVNPYTLLAAAIGVTIAAFMQGEKEANGYAQALAITGNQAGATVSRMQEMAVAISTGAATQGEAARAIAEVARTGKFTADQFAFVAEAAINMERATGQAIDKTVDQFANLAKDPVDAVAKLNAETHFLTTTVYEQIKALQEQGNTQAAAALAMESYADAVNQRTRDVEANLGTLQTAWRNLGTGAKWAWDQMLNIGREDTLSDKIRTVSEQINALQDDNPFTYMHLGVEQQKELVKQKRAELQKLLKEQRTEDNKAYTDAALQNAQDYAIAQDRNIAAHKSSDEKRAAEIKRSRAEADRKAADALRAGNKGLADQIRTQQAEYERVLNAEGKKKGGGGAAALANAEARAAMQAYKDALLEEQAAIQNSTKVLNAEYGAKLVTVEDFYARTRTLIQNDTKAQEAAILGQISVLKNRNVTGKDAANVQRELGQLEAQLSKVRADGATNLAILAIQEKVALESRAEAIKQYRRALDDTTQAMKDTARAQADRLLMSDKEFAKQQQLNDVYRKGADRLRELQEALANRKIDRTTYDAEVQANQEAVDAQVGAVEQGYVLMGEAQNDWLAGLQRGMENWMNQASDVNSQIEQLTQRSFDRMTDTLTEFALTGKLKWKEMLADILKEIVRFLAKQAVLKFVQFAASAWGGGATGASASGTGGVTFAAKGETFSGPGISAHSNTVTNQPTPFMFAKGAGIFGEAGWEAVMPLTRGPDGNLGVRAAAGGSTVVNLSVNTIINSDGTGTTTTDASGEDAALYKQFSDRMRTVCNEELQRALKNGGLLWKAGVTSK